MCHLSPKVPFWNRQRKETEENPANPGSPGKWPLE